ncbi:MAG: SPOR domain-containing protein [bacterium]
MFIILLFTAIVVNNNEIYKIDTGGFSFNALTLKEEIIDYKIPDLLYVLTNRNIYSIDTINLRILDRTPLPQKFNYLSIGKDEIFLVANTEIIILNKINFAFKTGIGIEPGDYEPIVEPIQLPHKNLIYLITHNEKKSTIKIIDSLKGKKIKNSSFVRIKKLYYLPVKKEFVVLTQSGLLFLDLNLKIKNSIKTKFPGEDFFFYQNGYIITNPQAICLVDPRGKVIDLQPLVLTRPLLNSNFFFWNNDFMILIDSLTLRIKYLSKNTENIYAVFPLDAAQRLCINKDNALLIMENRTSSIINLIKREYAHIETTETHKISQDSLFYLQFGAFSDKQYAQHFCDSIRKIGLPVFIEAGTDNFYRIKLGGFMGKNLVQEIMEHLNIPGWLVFQKKIEFERDSLFTFNHNDYFIQKGIIIKRE